MAQTIDAAPNGTAAPTARLVGISIQGTVRVDEPAFSVLVDELQQVRSSYARVQGTCGPDDLRRFIGNGFLPRHRIPSQRKGVPELTEKLIAAVFRQKENVPAQLRQALLGADASDGPFLRVLEGKRSVVADNEALAKLSGDICDEIKRTLLYLHFPNEPVWPPKPAAPWVSPKSWPEDVQEAKKAQEKDEEEKVVRKKERSEFNVFIVDEIFRSIKAAPGLADSAEWLKPDVRVRLVREATRGAVEGLCTLYALNTIAPEALKRAQEVKYGKKDVDTTHQIPAHVARFLSDPSGKPEKEVFVSDDGIQAQLVKKLQLVLQPLLVGVMRERKGKEDRGQKCDVSTIDNFAFAEVMGAITGLTESLAVKALRVKNATLDKYLEARVGKDGRDPRASGRKD